MGIFLFPSPCPSAHQMTSQRWRLLSLRQGGAGVKDFAYQFLFVAEGLNISDAELKDIFNTNLNEPVHSWEMGMLGILSFWQFVGYVYHRGEEGGLPPLGPPPIPLTDYLVPSPPMTRNRRRRNGPAVAPPEVADDAASACPEVAEDTAAPTEEAGDAAAPPVKGEEAAAPPVVADGAAAPPVSADEAAASCSRKRRRRRRKASSTLQELEAVPEPSAGQEAVPESPKRLALPAPPKRLALPAPPKRLALPAPPKRLALPGPSRLPVLPGPPWQTAKLLAHPWPPDGLELAWSVPPAPPWPSSRVPVWPDPPWSIPPAPPWLFGRVPVWPDPPWSVPPAPPWLPARIPGLPEPPWLNPPVPPWTCWASLLALAWLPSLPPLFVFVFDCSCLVCYCVSVFV